MCCYFSFCSSLYAYLFMYLYIYLKYRLAICCICYLMHIPFCMSAMFQALDMGVFYFNIVFPTQYYIANISPRL